MASAFLGSFFRIGIDDHTAFIPVENSSEAFSRSNQFQFWGPARNAQLFFDFPSRRSKVSLASRSILLINVKMGILRMTEDLKKLSCLCLNTLGAVNYHDGGIRSHQGFVVGVLGEILVSGVSRILDAVSVIFQTVIFGGGDGNTSLLFYFHPVGNSVSGGCLAFTLPARVNGSSVRAGIFFGQGRFSGIGMGYDCKSPSSVDFHSSCLLHFFFPPKRYVGLGILALFMWYIIPPWQDGTGMLATGMNFRHALNGEVRFRFELG